MRRSARSRTRSRGETRALARARAQIDQTTLTLRHNDFTPGEVNPDPFPLLWGNCIGWGIYGTAIGNPFVFFSNVRVPHVPLFFHAILLSAHSLSLSCELSRSLSRSLALSRALRSRSLALSLSRSLSLSGSRTLALSRSCSCSLLSSRSHARLLYQALSQRLSLARACARPFTLEYACL